MSVQAHDCHPEQIAGFLDQSLSDSELAALENHLSKCSACRKSLGDQTAAAELWDKARRYLRDERDEPDPLSGASDVASAQDRSHAIQAVLGALRPTDDPEMLGRLGGLEVAGVVGAGAMGVVLKAFDNSLDRTVAVKVLAPHLASSGAARKRFAREAKAAAAVLHPNVMAIHSVSNPDESLPYLVMPYSRGASLQKRLDQEGPLPLAEMLRIGSQIAAGLAAAHAQGLVHRDIKPANILLEEGVERVAITDFGLARAVDDATLTRTGMIVGTPQYMSPEQARGDSVDQRSDLFSLGSVLYAMCTGRAPFRAETSYGVLRRITDEEPRPIREISPEVPQWLCAIVAKLMAKRPEDRFESAEQVAELLEDCLAHVQQPTAAPLPDHISLHHTNSDSSAKRTARARKGAIVMIAALAVGLLVVSLWQTPDPPGISGSWTGTQAPSAEKPEGVVRVLCIDAAGKPVEGAEVHLFQHSGDGRDNRYLQFGPLTSDAEGKVLFPNPVFSNSLGNFDRWIYARVPRKLVGVGRSARWMSTLNVINPDARVIMVPSRSVQGQVTVPKGFDPAAVTVSIRTMHVATGDGHLAYESFPRYDQFPGLDTSLPDIFERRPGRDGRIRFDDIPVRGHLYLVTSGKGLGEAQWRNNYWNVRSPNDRKKRTFDEPIEIDIEKEMLLFGRVQSPTGDPAPGIEVRARIASSNENVIHASTFRAVTDEAGEFRLSGLPDLRFVVSANDPAQRWVFRPLEDVKGSAGNGQQLILPMERGVLISGRVVDPAGKAVAGAALSVVADSREGAGLAHERTDYSGRYSLRIPAGQAKLYFNALPDGFAYPNPPIVKHLEIQAGQEPIENLDFTLERQAD